MEKFIAFFDYLGFKQFIDNNNLEYQSKIMGNKKANFSEKVTLMKDVLAFKKQKRK